jgi:hypothetical protein
MVKLSIFSFAFLDRLTGAKYISDQAG